MPVSFLLLKKKKKGHFGSFTMNGSGSKFDIKLIK